TSTLSALKSLADKFPEHIYAAYGLHPCSVRSDYRDELNRIKEFAQHESMIAIGEIGIDLYWDATYQKEQWHALEIQFQWAVEHDLPVILHTREGFDVAWDIVKAFPRLRGVFHAFTGTAEQASWIIERGFYVGIGGIVTFKNAGLDRIVATLPMESILLETDSPYLSPVPHRGKRNEPAYLQWIAKKIAHIKSIDFEEVVHITTHNAKQLFKF
ncbi:MAG: TatD family hydrolase, partial [Bacteroidales bacterium]